MDGVEVTGVFNANAFFQTLATLLSRKYGVELSLKSAEKAEKWTSIVYRAGRTKERDSA